ncbi:MAG: ATP-grasp domain-containing protein [Xanthobacteraceae bacterium]|nr:ATP-grasp domain-containing protein [Xanthobacteraceae bacterium]
MILSVRPLSPGVPASSHRGPGALIVGGAHGSLAMARSLGRKGIPVWFLTHDHPIASYSRYVLRRGAWPGPDAKGAAEWLVDFAAHHHLVRWVLFPGGDAEARLVAQCPDLLGEAFVLTTPAWPIARFMLDKQLAHQHADAVGVASPWSYFPVERNDVAKLACPLPAILKPTVFAGRNRFTAAKAWRVDDRASLVARYDEAAALVGRDAIMVQEFIPGGGEAQFSYAGAWDRGKPVASVVARRTRQYPVEFGFTSTFVETIEHPDVEAQAFRFLADLRFSGLVEVEFKFDARDGRLKLLDVNPRAWTWIGLGAAAGVDFPAIAYALATGETVARQRGGAGFAWAHVSRDMVSAARSLIAGSLGPADYLRSLRQPTTFAAFAADDPWPGVADLPILARRVLSRQGALARRRPDEMSRKRTAPTI